MTAGSRAGITSLVLLKLFCPDNVALLRATQQVGSSGQIEQLCPSTVVRSGSGNGAGREGAVETWPAT